AARAYWRQGGRGRLGLCASCSPRRRLWGSSGRSVRAPSVFAVEAFDIAFAHDEIVELACRDMGADIGRDFRNNVCLGAAPFEDAIHEPIGPKIFDAADAEWESLIVARRLDFLGQASFRPEADVGLAVLAPLA